MSKFAIEMLRAVEGISLEPLRMSDGAIGYDVKAGIDVVIGVGCTELVPCGFAIGLSDGWEAQMRGRSGLALKHGIWAHVGTIDSDYRGEVGMILHNLGDKPFTINAGDRIGQMILNEVPGSASWRRRSSPRPPEVRAASALLVLREARCRLPDPRGARGNLRHPPSGHRGLHELARQA